MSQQLDQQAIDILRANDRGGYTVPTARLYPYQWNWDSAFVALGFATFDRDRAWRELELLLEGQWADGMVPHILFRQNDPDYFPGPSVWQSPDHANGGGKIPSGGISQPPVLASIVYSLLTNHGDDARAERMFDKILNWHRWYHNKRTPDGHSVVATVHPWETGRDNCPDWQFGFENMQVDPDIGPYERKDTTHVDASMRPSREQYDKYLTMIKFGRDNHWDQKKITNDGPFVMADPGIHFILLRADRDLLAIAKRLGRSAATAEIEGWIKQGVEASQTFWNEEAGAFCAYDIRSGQRSNGFTNASALCFYAGVGTDEQKAKTIENMERISKRVAYMLPSWDPDDHLFEPQRYWCGPVWPQMNRVIAMGLQEVGEFRLAEKLRSDTAALVEKSGFWECFNPITGEGCIGANFSWTAAMWLAWASPKNKAIAA